MIRREHLPTGLELDRRLRSHESGVLALQNRFTQMDGDRIQINILHYVFEFDTMALLALLESEAEKIKAELTKLGVNVG